MFLCRWSCRLFALKPSAESDAMMFNLTHTRSANSRVSWTRMKKKSSLLPAHESLKEYEFFLVRCLQVSSVWFIFSVWSRYVVKATWNVYSAKVLLHFCLFVCFVFKHVLGKRFGFSGLFFLFVIYFLIEFFFFFLHNNQENTRSFR